MKNWREEYREKLLSPDEAVKVIRSGDWVDYAMGICAPNELDAALARRKEELQDVKIRSILTVWPNHCVAADPNGEHFCWNSWHFSGSDRRYGDQGLAYYIPMKFYELPRMILENHTDVFMATVSPMDKHGWFNLGASNTACWASIEKAKYILLEVNHNIPHIHGGNQEVIHISQVSHVCESSNLALPTLSTDIPTLEAETRIAEHIMGKIRNASCLQLGIGAIPNAIGKMVAKSDLIDLGIHTEMYVDAFLDMSEAGKISGKYKSIDRNKQVFSFVFGSKNLYEFLDDNPELASYPIDYTNDPCIIGHNDHVISINAAINVDLFGQVSSESVATRHISGTGGQLDFVEGAYRSNGGQSFICLPSTKRLKGQLQSQIVPLLSEGTIVTDPRTATHKVVTEYGIADLKGKSTWERTQALINIAHPQFREQLIRSAEQMKIWRKSNKR